MLDFIHFLCWSSNQPPLLIMSMIWFSPKSNWSKSNQSIKSVILYQLSCYVPANHRLLRECVCVKLKGKSLVHLSFAQKLICLCHPRSASSVAVSVNQVFNVEMFPFSFAFLHRQHLKTLNIWLSWTCYSLENLKVKISFCQPSIYRRNVFFFLCVFALSAFKSIKHLIVLNI